MFGSVEAVDQFEADTGPDIRNDAKDSPQLPTRHSPSLDLSNQHPDSDSNPPVTETAAESRTPQQSDELSKVLNEKMTVGSPPEGEDVVDPVARDKIFETETVSESELFEGSRIILLTETSEENPTVDEKGQTTDEQSKVLKAADARMILKSSLENTNVLKLETEIHNEYFQAPPLGQTLTFQADRSIDLKAEASCVPTEQNDTNRLTDKNPPQVTGVTDAERSEAPACDFAETKKDKAADFSFERPGSDSPVRQVLNALQSASRGSLTLVSHSRQSPDSDDSPSALEMEDIPSGITCVTSEDIKARPLAGLAAPPTSLAQREKMASEDLVYHLDTACNTSPEGTDLGLSEEEPEMENVLTEPESAEMGGDTKHDESSEEQTYSVSIRHNVHVLFINSVEESYLIY